MIRYPLTEPIFQEMSDRYLDTFPRHRVAYKDFDRDVWYYAPQWLAWLYKWLPVSWGWNNHPEHRRRQEGAYFLWYVAAARWSLAYCPRSRMTYPHSRWFWTFASWGNRG